MCPNVSDIFDKIFSKQLVFPLPLDPMIAILKGIEI